MHAMTQGSRATVIVTQRERFGMTQESLESLYAHTQQPFSVIVVDGKSPARTTEYLREASTQLGFTLIKDDRYLTPNEARNLGLKAATTDYVVVVDNDVIFSDGWLETLVACADETGAGAVAPLTCEGLPTETRIHHAGGAFTEAEDIAAFFDEASPHARQFTGIMHGHHTPIADYDRPLKRELTGTCEFHCVLVRRSVFDKTGLLDEALLSSKEHIDFSISLHKAGETMYFEPASVVTYVFPCRDRPLEKDDRTHFAVRWSDAHGRRSVDHFIRKWNLRTRPDYVARACSEFKLRRTQGLLLPFVRRLPVIGRHRGAAAFVAKALAPAERIVNHVTVMLEERASRR